MKKEHREKTSLMATQRIVDGDGNWGLKKFKLGKFRSKYEHAFAVYLKELGIKFEFEKHGEQIENITGTKLHYIPDFFLPEYNVYVEIVNTMNRRLAHKMYWYEGQYKFTKLIVFDKQHLRDMFDSKFNIYDIIGYPIKTKLKT